MHKWLFLPWPSQPCHRTTKDICSNSSPNHSVLPVALSRLLAALGADAHTQG